MSRGHGHAGAMAMTIAIARIGVSALESWWRTTKLAPESSRSKPAR